ncbi:MAG: hypothetical protein LJE67_07720 [Salaquimonas sp.]|jgi:hypothetical protein|nr:hypothetical protein [Salaquimonas sp.]
MQRKPNYGFERSERAKTKAQKKAEKLQAKAEKTAARKTDGDETDATESED